MKHKFEIYQHIGDISQPNNGWTKELNYISWDDREPVYDIRTWSSDHTEYGKGVTITPGEMRTLQELIRLRQVLRDDLAARRVLSRITFLSSSSVLTELRLSLQAIM